MGEPKVNPAGLLSLEAARRVAESEISAIKEQMAGVEKQLVDEMVKRRALL